MRQKAWKIGLAALIVMFLVSSIAGMFVAFRNNSVELKILVGKAYEESPELAASILSLALEEGSMEEMKSGELAAKNLGYTGRAYDFYLSRLHFDASYIVCLTGCIFSALAILFLFIKNQKKSESYIVNLEKKIREDIHEDKRFEAVKYADNSIVRLEKTIDNLTKSRRNRKNYFEKREAQMNLFVENIAHQIKTPLSGILLNLELLENRISKSEDKQGNDKIRHDRTNCRLIQDAIRQCDKIHKYIYNLLNLSRMEAGKIHFAKETVMLQELLDDIQAEFGKSKVALHILEQEDENLCIQGDQEWLHEAIFNLVDNSVKYADSSKPVDICVTVLRDSVKIKIFDCGKGLSDDCLEHLFDRFYVGNRDNAASTGIGLNLARYVVEGHYGKIHADSREGQGTLIELCLPKLQLKEKLA